MAPHTFELELCPHCGSDARLERHDAYRFRCRAFGKPRIPMDAKLATTDERTAAALKTAHRQRLAKFAWQLGGIGAALVAMVSGLVSVGANALFDFGLTGGGVALAFTLLPVLAAVT